MGSPGLVLTGFFLVKLRIIQDFCFKFFYLECILAFGYEHFGTLYPDVLGSGFFRTFDLRALGSGFFRTFNFRVPGSSFFRTLDSTNLGSEPLLCQQQVLK